MNEANETLAALARTMPAAFMKGYEKAKQDGRHFKSNIKIPRSANKHLVARAMDRIVVGQSFDDATHVLTPAEKDLVSDLVAEFTAWASLNDWAGHDDTPPPEQSPISVEPVLVGTKEE